MTLRVVLSTSIFVVGVILGYLAGTGNHLQLGINMLNILKSFLLQTILTILECLTDFYDDLWIMPGFLWNLPRIIYEILTGAMELLGLAVLEGN
ncbi:hypothetical protein JTB14_032904 [Gonioctena quinquepunctata]|nr:hypothetical protein JTB14_032904 [Gonioctena quinquepunctata]